MSDQQSLSLQSVVVRAKDAFWQDVVGDVVILDLEQGQYFGVEDTGAVIWRFLDEPVRIAAICDRLINLYDVDQEVCNSELLAFIEQLRAANLIVIVDAAND